MSNKIPSTPANRLLRAQKVSFTEHLYDYVEHGGTEVAAQALGLPEHAVIKTLVLEDERHAPLIMLMHGDRVVSLKNLARAIGCKHVEPCKPEVAERHSGYRVGGTSPFGTRKRMPVYVEASVMGLEKIWINGGSRGYLVGIAPADLQQLAAPTPVDAAQA
ncbi:Cys-tRNA(Pro) deacylase [Niveibacterium sp. SC-1]|uniref:Cys-tRNA(Pro) deacylase n=1 Tax=Niveibacterium sp. SC-1 TaxID=3135646 RepID=UPI00311E641E